MFMSPRELHANVDGYSDFGGYVDKPKGADAWSTGGRNASLKASASERSGMDASIAAEGVKKPLAVTHSRHGRILGDGHHRMLAQETADPDRLMPIEHHEGVGTIDTFNDHQGRDPTGDSPRRFLYTQGRGNV